MTKIELLEADLERDEGRRSKPYRCTSGKLTIGVGRNLDDVGLYEDEIDLLLHNDIKRVIADLLTFPWFMGLDSVRKRATANLRFQLGPGGFRAFNKGPTSTLAALAAGDYDTAASRLLKNKIARQTPERMARIAQMWRTGEA